MGNCKSKPTAEVVMLALASAALLATAAVALQSPDPTADPKERKPEEGRESNQVNDTEIFISARFLGNDMEDRARQVCVELKKLGRRAFIVDANAGDDFGEMTMANLYKMKSMVVIACDEYGARTKNSYSSYYELKHANENNKHIIAVQMCKNWPPKPSKGDIDNKGVMQNSFVLGKDGLCRLRWNRKKWNASECAKEISEAFLARHRESSKKIEECD